MNIRHEHVLADIERRVRADGVSLDEVDARIAEELGAPLDYYFAYLLVWGAVEAYCEAHALVAPAVVEASAQGDTTLDRARWLTSGIGSLASAIYQQAAVQQGGREIAALAGRILGSVLQLGQNLCDLDASAATPVNGAGGVVSR